MAAVAREPSDAPTAEDRLEHRAVARMEEKAALPVPLPLAARPAAVLVSAPVEAEAVSGARATVSGAVTLTGRRDRQRGERPPSVSRAPRERVLLGRGAW